ncbi:MAG: aminotransferase class I/II-fold pyridoxal phosphate-dependent enzyme [Candidatus Eremiobacterota bacterium]
MKKDIVILAAGIGKRLLPYTMEMPKCLVEVNNRAIIENILDSLIPYSEQINKIHIVVGYKKEDIIKRLDGKYKELHINYVENEIFEETNNIYSLWLAGEFITNDLILFESDVYFDHIIIENLFNTDKNIALVDNYENYMEGTALEIDSNDRITNIITQKRHAKLNGLYKTLNLYHFNKNFFREIFLPTLEIYMKTQSKNSYYEIILKLLVFIGKQDIYAKPVKSKSWYEIDDMEDLRIARYLFSSDDEKIDYLSKSFGGYWNYKFHDFNLLYNDYFPSDEFIEEIKNYTKNLIACYPSNDRILIDKTRKILPFEVEGEHVVLGNGSCQIIKELFKCFASGKSLIPLPSFGEYVKEEYNSIYFPTEDDNFTVNIERLIATAEKEQVRQIILVNPNNPTGLIISRKDIIRLLTETSAGYIVIDESFMNFAKESESITGLYKNYKNLIIVKSFGKEYGIPGIRLGCAITCNKEIIKTLRENLPIWNINSFAEFFLDRIGKYKDDYYNSIRKIRENRKHLKKSLEKISVYITGPSGTNFLFCKLPKGHVKELQKYLFITYNILIKVINKQGVSGKNYFRVSVRTPELNRILVKGIKEYMFNTERTEMSGKHLSLGLQLLEGTDG